MLKKIRGLFLGLVVLAGSACVTPTHASSAPSVIIIQVQASGISGAKEELVTIYNNSPVEADITGWCLKNKAAISFACFREAYITAHSPDTPPATVHSLLPPYSTATISSKEYSIQSEYEPEYFSLIYEVANGTSGSIVSSTDTITLVNTEDEVVDSTSWTSPLVSGKAWSRVKVLNAPDVYATNVDATDWNVTNVSEPSQNMLVLHYTQVDEDDVREGEELPIKPHPRITEFLPNPAGIDAQKEFIELYNPGDEVLSLNQYKIRVGLDNFKWYNFPINTSIHSHEYVAFFSDTLNNFSLPNTKGAVQLFKDENPVGEFIQYEMAKDDATWALFDEGWEYTTIPTPARKNQRPLATLTTKPYVAAVVSEKKPCAPDQYRNPETGRCKRAASNVSTPTPCKEGQERNPETNRCRTPPKPAQPTPCKPGQERNSETNRCRTITKMTDASYGVKGASTKADAQTRWYYWLGIGVAVVLVVGYAVWEWRQELLKIWQWVYRRFVRR